MVKINSMFGMLKWFFTPVKLYGGDGGGESDAGSGGTSTNIGPVGPTGSFNPSQESLSAAQSSGGSGGTSTNIGPVGPTGSFNPSQESLSAAQNMNSNPGWTTEQFEGGTVSYDAYGSYSVVEGAKTYGYDVSTGISYSTTGNGYGVTATNAAGKTATYNTITDLKAELEETRLNAAKKAGASVGSILGPVGTVVGYFIGDQVYASINPDKVSETLSREAFEGETSALEGVTNSIESGLGKVGIDVDFPSIQLSAQDYSSWRAGGELSIESSGGGETNADGTTSTPTYSATVSEQSLSDKYEGQDLTSEQLGLEYLDFMKEQQDAWNKIYEPVQQNLSEYYQNLTPDSYEARSVQAIQQSYQEQSTQLTQSLAQRGLDTSGLQAQTQTQLAASAAGQKAEARATADDYVAQQKQTFLNAGISQQSGIMSGTGSAYSGLVSTLANQETAATQAASQAATTKSNEKNALLGAVGTGLGLIFG